MMSLFSLSKKNKSELQVGQRLLLYAEGRGFPIQELRRSVQKEQI